MSQRSIKANSLNIDRGPNAAAVNRPGPIDSTARDAFAAPIRIFHICSRAAAQQAQADGSLRPASLASEGFVHLSQTHQVRAVIAAFYADVRDLVVLEVDPARLTAPLRYEAPATMPGTTALMGAPAPGLFPHLYGPLNADAIVGQSDAVTFGAA